MAGEKIGRQFNINEDHLHFLEEMGEQYDLQDIDKVLRVLLDYAMEDGDREEIFARVRCLRC